MSLSITQLVNYKGFFFNLSDHFDYSEHLSNESTKEEVMEAILDYAIPQEATFIYYAEATAYISKESSFQEALELAQEMDYELKDINVCILASLVKEQILTNELYRNEDEIDAFFNTRS